MIPFDARQWTLLLASTLTVMAGAALAPALPTLEQVFAATPQAGFLTRLLLTLPALFIVLAAPLAGVLVDRVGRLRLLWMSVLLYVLAGSSGALLDRLDLILVGRALLGVAVAGLMTSVTTLIADYYAGAERDRVFGRQGAFMSLGGVGFLLLGGLATDLHWRAAFGVYLLPLLLLPALLALPPPRPQALDTALDLSRLPRVRLALIYAAALIGMMIFYIIPVQMPYHLAERAAISSTAIGLVIAVSNLCGGIAGFGFARLRQHLQPMQIITLVYLLMAVGYAAIGLSTSLVGMLFGLACAGFGLGLTIPNLTTWLASFTPPAMRGRLIGGLTAAVFIGQFLSPLAAQPFVDRYGTAGPFLAAAVLLLLLAGLAFLLRHRA
jgi:MFS family permease